MRLKKTISALVFVSFFLHSVFITDILAASNGPGPFFTLLSGSLNYQYVSTEADTVTGAGYTRKFSNPASLKIELGFLPTKYVYFGFVYDRWMAGRTFDAGAGEIADVLDYQVVGAEVGYITANPRAFCIVSGFVGYPLSLSIASSNGNTYLPASLAPLVFGGRGMVGLRFTQAIALLLEAGYRLRNLGVFTSTGTAYLTSGEALNFSGFYISTGVGLTL